MSRGNVDTFSDVFNLCLVEFADVELRIQRLSVPRGQHGCGLSRGGTHTVTAK